jgi:hypothetical protein
MGRIGYSLSYTQASVRIFQRGDAEKTKKSLILRLGKIKKNVDGKK